MEASYIKTDDYSVKFPDHTCIIKATMKYGKVKNSRSMNSTMYDRIIDECGDSDIRNPKKKFVDVALNFFTMCH